MVPFLKSLMFGYWLNYSYFVSSFILTTNPGKAFGINQVIETVLETFHNKTESRLARSCYATKENIFAEITSTH